MTACVSTIAEVCVYPGQAQVVRRGRVELPAGPNEVLLPDLPLSLLPETVRVAGQGTAQVRLLGVEVGKARYTEPPEEALAELDTQIEHLEDDDRQLAGKVEALNRHLMVLAGLGQASAARLPWGVSRGQVDVAGVEALLDSLEKGEEKAREQVRQLEIKRRELGRELERLRRLRQDRSQPRTPDRYAVRVPVEVEAAGELEVELTYVCQGASWAPLYDLRLDEAAEGGPRVALAQLAEVTQQTGEDWSGVRLSVSTARPALAARLPELNPWTIDLYRPELLRAKRSGPLAALAAAPAGYTRAGEEEMQEQAAAPPPAPPVMQAAVAVAEVRTEGPAILFIAPGSPSIPADGSPHKVFLGTQDLSAQLDWITAPKAEAHVYRRARITNATPAILLPGQASIFHGDTFVGTTRMPETPPQDEFEVYLGVDDQVRVERELVDQSVDKGGIVGQVRRMVYGYRIQMRSLRAERLALTVLDQLPVSRHESLKVKLLRSEPAVQPGDMGELRWELDLASGEEREIAFSFQVEMPLEAQVVGL